MKTDDFVSLLATQSLAVDARAAPRRLFAALAVGALAATLLMTVTLGPRHDFAVLAGLPAFWVKIGFVASLFAASLCALARLSRPGARLGPLPAIVAAPPLALWIIALAILVHAAPEARGALVLGQTWKTCALLIAMLSAPVFVALAWAMKEFAPTRLRLAGAGAGLLAGSTGALVYCLHCPEIAAPFLGVWYVVGILVPTAFGALVGERLLRW
jgi:hypothetical protein